MTDWGGMTGSEIGPAIAIARVVIERAAPAGMKLLRSWVQGKTIVVAGPARSGKTTFMNYLQFGAFEHVQETPKTYSPAVSKRFNFTVGNQKNLEVMVKTVIDLPGQYPDLSEIVFEQRPHALLIMLDLSAPLEDPHDPRSSGPWLEHFLSRLDQRWTNADGRRNKLSSVTVVMNKADLVDSSRFAAAEKMYKSTLAGNFRAARGPKLVEATLRKCILVENPEGTKWVDSIIFEIARNVTR
jgi:hypothetical protein